MLNREQTLLRNRMKGAVAMCSVSLNQVNQYNTELVLSDLEILKLRQALVLINEVYGDYDIISKNMFGLKIERYNVYDNKHCEFAEINVTKKKTKMYKEDNLEEENRFTITKIEL